MRLNSDVLVGRVCVLTLALSAMFFGVGCNGNTGNPKVVPVTGTVLYKGEPVEGATIAFWADSAPRAATGVSNAKGEFSLSLFGANDGAIPGTNKITVNKAAAAAPAAAANNTDMLNNPGALANASAGLSDAPQEAPKPLLPPIYGSRETSTLKETVTQQGPNKFVLQLVD